IEVIAEPQSLSSVHGRNNVNTISYEEERRRLDHVYEALNARLRERGVHVDAESWRADSWVNRLHRAEHELLTAVAPGMRTGAPGDLEEVLPGGATFILVDEAWYSDLRRDGAIVPGRRDVPFLEGDGEYCGRPADDAIAVAEMYRLRQEGASFIVFTGNCFWWL